MQIKYLGCGECGVSIPEDVDEGSERQVSEERNYQVWMGHPVHSDC